VILCEDRVQEHFVRKLCEELGHRSVRVIVAPSGRGSGEGWIRSQYPGEVKKLRGHGDELVGLVAVTDGDRFGVAKRKHDLAQALAEAGYEPRTGDERIAICIPTWSVETWLAWLCGLERVDEATKYKHDASYMAAQRKGDISPKKAVQAWLRGPHEGEGEQLASLDDGRREMQRLAV
jgi:hypothetical protein